MKTEKWYKISKVCYIKALYYQIEQIDTRQKYNELTDDYLFYIGNAFRFLDKQYREAEIRTAYTLFRDAYLKAKKNYYISVSGEIMAVLRILQRITGVESDTVKKVNDFVAIAKHMQC